LDFLFFRDFLWELGVGTRRNSLWTQLVLLLSLLLQALLLLVLARRLRPVCLQEEVCRDFLLALRLLVFF